MITSVFLGADPGVAGDLAPSTVDAGATPGPSASATERACPSEAGERFVLRRRIGAGGMGVVYEADDLRRGETVALKTISRVGPAHLARFKREFRALADVHHPNLVTLHELVSSGGDWFLSMELIDGDDFLTYARDGGAGPGSPGSLDRLRGALRQLAEGLSALHGAGKLHRDIKPSNVLVARSGRVVVLDFGLVAEAGAGGLHRSTDDDVVGTIAYMSPEQARGAPVSSASDWYSVGVMIYQALTGRLPHDGSPIGVLLAKQGPGPPPPRSVRPDVPGDLDTLCADLLRSDPARRPSGAEILQRLGGEAGAALPATTPTRRSPALLVGRETHLEALTSAFRTSTRGRAVVVAVHGTSGAGKSALIERFAEGLIDRGEAVVLRGRCYHQESVPFKAFDGVLDSLGRYLGRLPGLEAAAVAPRDVPSLVRVFPALEPAAVAAPAVGPRTAAPAADPQELRRRAFEALRELLSRLGDRRPLVVAIDDLQWGDRDSAAVLSALLRPPDPPGLLLVGCYRTEDAANPLVRVLLESPAGEVPAVDRRTLAVGPLGPDDSVTLARALLGPGADGARHRAEGIAREAAGSPLFIAELVRHAQAGISTARGPRPGPAPGLDDLLWARVRALPDDARRLLEVVATSGQPLGLEVAFAAARLEGGRLTAISRLRSGRLIRGTGVAERDEVDTYHDRVREAVLDRIPASVLAGHHLRLAHCLERAQGVPLEVVALHLLFADEPDRAGDYYARAATAALEGLAFYKAAGLFRLALDLCPDGRAEKPGLRVATADALAYAGLGAEAASLYLAAAAAAPPDEAIDLRARAALQHFISGQVDEGFDVLSRVLPEVGLSLPLTPGHAVLAVLLRRLWVRVRGFGFRAREAAAVPRRELRRIDIAFEIASCLSLIEPVTGAYFQVRGVLLALSAGEPYRVFRSLGFEATHLAALGRPYADATAGPCGPPRHSSGSTRTRGPKGGSS